jgi:hypothetical protein
MLEVWDKACFMFSHLDARKKEQCGYSKQTLGIHNTLGMILSQDWTLQRHFRNGG